MQLEIVWVYSGWTNCTRGGVAGCAPQASNEGVAGLILK